MTTLPSSFEKRMKELLGDEFEAFKNEVTSGKPTKAFFTNKNIGRIDLAQFNVEAVGFYNGGYYFDYEGIGKTPLHHGGGIYIQDPSAMATIASLGDRKFCRVLDMCASPGGKSLGACLLQDGGILVANEYVSARCKTLVGNFERFGVKNAIVTCLDMTKKCELHDIYPEFFDLIICDAPCSGEGMFRKYPDEAISEWSEENVRICAERQAEILDNAVDLLSENGLLLYSTCTFSLEENEIQVDKFLKRHSEFELLDVCDNVKRETADGIKFDGCLCDIEKTRRFYPHISRGEGQYIALFRKTRSTTEKSDKDKYKSPLSPLSAVEKGIISEFTGKFLTGFDLEKVYKYNDNIVFIDFDAKVPTGKVFSCGVKLGEIVKNRFEPHHQFFKCFGNNFKNKIGIDDGMAGMYLHGDVFESDSPNGWCAVMYHGLVLGGGKVVDGVVKNHYPKGLRNL